MAYEEDDEIDGREMPDPADQDSFDEPGVMPCPHCRQLISEDAEQCHYCHEYISLEDAPTDEKPWWVWAGIFILLGAAILWMVM